MKFFLRDKGGARNHGLAEFRDAGRRPVQCIHTGGYLIVRPSASGTRQKLVNHEVHSVFAKSQTKANETRFIYERRNAFFTSIMMTYKFKMLFCKKKI